MNNVVKFSEEKKKTILAELVEVNLRLKQNTEKLVEVNLRLKQNTEKLVEANLRLKQNTEKLWEAFANFGVYLSELRTRCASDREFYKAAHRFGINRSRQEISDMIWLGKLNFNAFEMARAAFPEAEGPTELRANVREAWGEDFGMPKSSN